MSNEIFILSGARTAIGAFGGSLKDHNPTALGVTGWSALTRQFARHCALFSLK